MSSDKVMVALDNFEKCLLICGLSNLRNTRIQKGESTQDLERLMLKVMVAPTPKESRRDTREER